ncbi:unnamed protein product, partial [Meganyctiphanes norvegica]
SEERETEQRYCFSRCSSTGSLHTLTSSANNTDDEDSDRGGQMSYKERRREAHTAAEQKRRNAINKGYDSLQYLQKEKSKQEEDVAALQKEVVALTIMKLNYEQIVSAHQSQPGHTARQIPDDVKFQVFRAVMDSLYQSFDVTVSTNNFAEISGSVISWVEEHCQPQVLREIMCGVLQQLGQQPEDLNASTNSFI